MSHYAPQSLGLLEPINFWFNDPEVSEILINKPQEIFVEKKGEMKSHSIPAYTSHTLSMLFNLIARENHQEIKTTHGMLSGSLSGGARVQLVVPPVSRYHTLSIRKKVFLKNTLSDYKHTSFYDSAERFNIKENNNSLLSPEEKMLQHYYESCSWHDFTCLAVRLKKNIVISGATSTGKTTFLNACLNHIPKIERLITLEDTREIEAAHPNQVNLIAEKGGQHSESVTLQDLVQCSLRLRPDRIIVGEIRGKEVIDFVSACCTGHNGNITTIHASNPHIAFMRMCQMYKLNNVPSMRDEDILNELKQIVDIIIQLARAAGGHRYVQSVYLKNDVEGDVMRGL